MLLHKGSTPGHKRGNALMLRESVPTRADVSPVTFTFPLSSPSSCSWGKGGPERDKKC